MADIMNRRIDGPTLAAALISLLVFMYVAVRASALCITIDEASTYNCHVTGQWLDIILFRTNGLPDNNHLLNTLLCKVSVLLFGVSELSLRVPALIGCFSYLFGLNLCLHRIVSGWKIVPGLLAVGLNPYIIDFLGLARGYALGLGFTMLGLAALLSAFTGPAFRIRARHAQLSIVLFGFAALSNLAFLLVLGAALLLLAASIVHSATVGRGETETNNVPWPLLLLEIVLPALPFFIYLSYPAALISKLKLFGEGGHQGFWHDTVMGLLKGTAYADSLFWLNIQSVSAWVMVSSLFVPVALLALRRIDERKFVLLSVLAAMTFIISLGSVAQHYLFNVAYLEGRRAIFLVPLFLLTVIAFGDTPRQAAKWYMLPAMFLGLVVPLALAVHDLSSVNCRYINDWNVFQGSRPAMLIIRNEIDGHSTGQPRKLLVNEDFVDCMGFYRSMFHMERSLAPVESGGLDGPADFYYGYDRDEPTIARYGARPLFRDIFSHSVLYGKAGVPRDFQVPVQRDDSAGAHRSDAHGG